MGKDYLMKPYFALAYNHDQSSLEEIAKVGVSEIWAGVYMPGQSNFGSGRFQRTSVDKVVNYDDLGKDFLIAKNLGIKTSFLLNPACTGNKEFTLAGMKEIKEIARFLNRYQVDYITIAEPFLSMPFKKLAPNTRIKLSSHYNVNNLGKMKFLFDDLNIDLIIVSQFANKNFRLLKKAVKQWSPEKFEVMCTVACIAGCPMRTWHGPFAGHSVDVSDQDFLPLNMPCLAETHNSKTKALTSMFVRREDVQYYQQIGINKFKIGERRDNKEENLKTARYYLQHDDQCNPFFKKSKVLNKMNLKAMDGFYDKFFNEECDCTEYDCHACSHCDDYAEKVFTHSESDIQELKIPESKEYFQTILFKKWMDRFDSID